MQDDAGILAAGKPRPEQGSGVSAAAPGWKWFSTAARPLTPRATAGITTRNLRRPRVGDESLGAVQSDQHRSDVEQRPPTPPGNVVSGLPRWHVMRRLCGPCPINRRRINPRFMLLLSPQGSSPLSTGRLAKAGLGLGALLRRRPTVSTARRAFHSGRFRVGAHDRFLRSPTCRLKAALRRGTERRLQAAAKNSVLRPSPHAAPDCS